MCVFSISEKRRLVWNEELELFEVFKTLCKRHNLVYYADGGTLLGAVRHSGFIPWDDDLDVVMMREDYDKFIEYAKKELPDNYFLQIPATEQDYFYGHAKIRKNNTTAIRYIQYIENYKHHQGIFIDIFPLDNVPDRLFVRKIHKWLAVKMMQFIYYAKYYYRLNNHSILTKIKHWISVVFLPTNKAIKRVFALYEWWYRLPNRKKTSLVGTTSTFYYLEQTNTWRRDWFEQPISMKFENTFINVPHDFDKVLTKSFGDYHTPVIAPSQHGDVFFDLDHDFKDYFNGSLSFTIEDCIL